MAKTESQKLPLEAPSDVAVSENKQAVETKEVVPDVYEPTEEELQVLEQAEKEAAQKAEEEKAQNLSKPVLASIRDITAKLKAPTGKKEAPYPAVLIKTRTQGGKVVKYAEHQTYTRYLDAYAPGWRSKVVGILEVQDGVSVTYEITIPCAEGKISRQSTGYESYNSKGYGDALLNAEAQAFKRAASKFGLFLSLYDK